LFGWIQSQTAHPELAAAAYDRAAALAFDEPRVPLETRLRLPFDGRWFVWQGPAGAYSHSSLRNRHAWDFQAVNSQGAVYRGRGRSNHDYLTFGHPLLAPAACRVVAVRDGVNDNRPGERNCIQSEGNLVVIEHAPGEFSRFFHLQCGSILVAVSDWVAVGQCIARGGNSGNSAAPHLCFSLVAGRDPHDLSIAARFDGYWVGRGVERRPGDGVPQKGEIIESQGLVATATPAIPVVTPAPGTPAAARSPRP
jgi:murein DD-endopeptidase MepM/ murein hydrolase activator NlpD